MYEQKLYRNLSKIIERKERAKTQESRNQFSIFNTTLKTWFAQFDLNWKNSTNCAHSNDSYWGVPFYCAMQYSVHGGSNVWFGERNLKVKPLEWKIFSSTFLWCCLTETIQMKGIQPTSSPGANAFRRKRAGKPGNRTKWVPSQVEILLRSCKILQDLVRTL